MSFSRVSSTRNSTSWPGLVGLMRGLVVVLVMGSAMASHAAPEPAGRGPGQVTLDLESFRELERRLAVLGERPSGVALTSAEVSVDASSPGAPRVTATLRAELTAELMVAPESGTGAWAEVALLPAGIALESATVDGAPLPLVQKGAALVWVARGSGVRELVLRYRAVELRAGVIEVPLPQSPSVTLTARLPGDVPAVEVSPGLVTQHTRTPTGTTAVAIVPRALSARLRWGRMPGGEAAIAAAEYRGELMGEVVRWQAELGVEGRDGEAFVAVARADVAVLAARVDGTLAPLEERGGYLFARVMGRGRKTLSLVFEAPLRQGEGPAGTALWTPRAPLSTFALTLDGDKEVTTVPAGGIERTIVGGKTLAKVALPVSDEVVFNWTSALPESAEQELRVNADVVHAVRADAGVLQVTAFATFEVARGKAQSFSFTVPEAVVVNAVRGQALSDWRVADPKDGVRLVSVYLDREVTGTFTMRVDYEVLVAGSGATEAGPQLVPLVTAEAVRRQRGMVALVRGGELEVKPVSVAGLTQVGENQLPVEVRDAVPQKVTHTYKYTETGARLGVELAPMERESARFDAAIDTLFSLGEGVVRGLVTVELTVKAGSFADLAIQLPAGINVLSASAPSLREHRVVEADGKRTLALSFTREMEGAVKVELVWERVLAPGDLELEVPLVHVVGAVLEHGRLAIEALSAVEVKELEASRVMRVDVQELPQKLVLRTTNPILLAYHYVHADPPAALKLSVKRHAEVAVQVATIDEGHHRTLWTRDGVALTRARYLVRNRGRQFLRVTLPDGATVWSAELAGQPVKPASDEKGAILVPLLNASEPFEVVLVYLVRGEPLGISGEIEGALLVPDLVETESTWEVFLPDDVVWGEVDTRMTVAAAHEHIVATELEGPGAKVTGATAAGESGVAPLGIRVPERGHRIVLKSLLSNQGSERATMRVSYRTGGLGGLGAALVFGGVFALGLLALRLSAKVATPRAVSVGVGVAALVAIVVGHVHFGASPVWALVAIFATGLLALGRHFAKRRATV